MTPQHYFNQNNLNNLEHIIKNSKCFIYFMEQISSRNKDNPKKYTRQYNTLTNEIIKHSLLSFDYNKDNFKYLENIIYLPPPVIINNNQCDKIYDILFIGLVNDLTRRKPILENLKRFFKIKIVYDKNGDELTEIINQSKVVLNLHYYNDNTLLEEVRLNEIINSDTHILSELPHIDVDNMKEKYKDRVKFINIIDKSNKIIKKTDSIVVELKKLLKKSNKKYKHNFNNDLTEKILIDNIKGSIEEYNKYNKYPHLFHKYLLKIKNPDKEIIYNIEKENKYKNFYVKNFAHLHCYDISKFHEIYDEYLDKIDKYFNIIITYSIGEIKDIDYTIIKIPNKGMDIGAKYCMIKYLNDKKLEYDYVMFLHSKSCPNQRKKYFQIVDDLNDNFIKNIQDYDSYFPDIKWEIIDGRLKMLSGNPEHKDTNWPERNLLYRNEILKYLNCDNNTNIFTEGNVYILKNTVINKLFTDKYLYNILNEPNDFDYNWITYRYGIKGDIKQVYDEFKLKKLKPRDEYSYDGYIEHVFERMVMNLCETKIFFYSKIENKTPEFINNKLWAHLHCYDIEKFNEIYGEYIENIMKYFSVIVTYSNGNSIPNYNFTVLKIQNKGADIGGKIIVIKYLIDNNVNYSNILFLHSKSNKIVRKKYFDPFIKNISQLNYICSIAYHYDLIIPDLVHDGDWNRKQGYTINKYYYNWYNNLMNFKHLTDLHIEGNCLIASKKIIDNIYPYNKLVIFYNKLNTIYSFDYNWVKFQYKLKNFNYEQVLKYFIDNKSNGNYLSYKNEKVISEYDYIFNNEPVNIKTHFLKDGSFEHLWERLWMNVCANINGKYKIIKECEIFEKINLKYNFDINLYKLLNNNQDGDNSIENINNIKKIVSNSKNHIYSLKQVLEKLPLNFDIVKYSIKNNLQNKNKYEIINHFIHNSKNNSDKKWVDLQTKYFNQIKTFVYVFPQFHEIPENNEFWGKGFTEWWNVRKTQQIHDKHLPMHPHPDIGYYNILDYDTRKRWSDYAEEYGFYGYIYCHFWFSKGIIMNKPLDKILEDGQPDKPWFLNWINENWTKRWDGGNNNILLDVKLNLDSSINHFKELLKYFNHNKYYKINNKPCLGVYRTNDISQSYIDKLNELSKQNGFDGITFIETLNMKWNKINEVNDNSFCELQFEYPVNYSGTLSKFDNKINDELIFFNKDAKSKVHTYDLNKHHQSLLSTTYDKPTMRGISPCWDNFPRHILKSNNSTFINSNSFDFYLVCLKQFLLLTKENNEYHFINALNEWAESCVMEPSIQNEYSYLESYKLAKKTDLTKINEDLLDKLIYYQNKKRIVFVSHNNFNSGAPIVLKNIISYFDKLNQFDIFLIITNNFKNTNNEEFNNVKYIYMNFNNQTTNDCEANIHVSEKLLKIINPDIVFINTVANYEFIKASNNLNLYNLLYIHEQNSEFKRIYNNNHEFSNFLDINQLKKVNKIVSCFPNVEYLNLLNIDYTYIQNGIDFNIIDKENKFYKYKKKTFGMCGYGTFRKGFDIFIKIAYKYSDYDFIWIGPNQYKDNIEIPANITITGYVNNVTYYLKNLEAILFTSREDPFPLALLEMLYLNKKIIASSKFKNNIGSFYLIEKFGIIINDEYDNLELIHNKDNINSKDYIKENFNIDKCCSKFKYIFDMINLTHKPNYINIDEEVQKISVILDRNKYSIKKKNYVYQKNLNTTFYNDTIYKCNYDDIMKNYPNYAEHNYKKTYITENRTSHPLNKVKTVAITLQLHNNNNIDLIIESVKKIIKMNTKFYYEIFLAYNDDDTFINEFKNNLIGYPVKINIIKCKNMGTDLYKFLKTLEFILKDTDNYPFKFDYFIKIHSKTDRNWLNSMLSIFNSNIFNIFEDNEIGMISSNKFNRLVLKNGKFLNNIIEKDFIDHYKFLGNLMDIDIDNIYNNTSSIDYIKKIHNNYSINLEEYRNNNDDLMNVKDDLLLTHYKERSLMEGRVINTDFLYKIKYPLYNSGTIFTIRGNVLYDTINLNTIKNIELKLEENKEYGYFQDKEKPTLTHALERFIGLLNFSLGYKYFGI